MGDQWTGNGTTDGGAGKGRYGLRDAQQFSVYDWARFALYGLAVVTNIVAILIEPVSAVWVDPFTRVSQYIAAVAGGTALTHITKAKD